MSHSSQTSCPGTSELTAFVSGKLNGADRDALRGHLAQCPACRKALAALPGGNESLSGQETHATAGVLAALTVHPRPAHQTESGIPADLASHPRYEILQLLG